MQFIPKYADHSYSLTKAIQKMAPKNILWSQEMLSDVMYLCNSLCSQCTLTVPRDCDLFLLQIDA